MEPGSEGGKDMRRIGIGVVGFGWMGRAHSRSCRRIPTLFPEARFQLELVVCADADGTNRDLAQRTLGFGETSDDWHAVVEHPEVDVVFVCAPNMLHEPVAVAAAGAGKHVFCEKPVGGTPAQTVRIERAARRAGVVTGVGYNYRWAPLVQYAKQLIDDGALGTITNYRGRFFSMYGADPLGLLSWRFLEDQAGHGASSDILSHSVDLAHMLVGPITRVVGTGETFIRERPLPRPGGASHYERGSPGDPTGAVTNEDYFGALVEFENGARGTFEASRSIVGPQSQNAFEVYGTEGALEWNFDTMNELRLFLASDRARGYATVYGGDRYPYHGRFVPGDANAIGYEDLKVIEDYEYLSAVEEGRQHVPGFEQALGYVNVQAALLESWATGCWVDVRSLREE
jgi:predicted dehydrogenase